MIIFLVICFIVHILTKKLNNSIVIVIGLIIFGIGGLWIGFSKQLTLEKSVLVRYLNVFCGFNLSATAGALVVVGSFPELIA